MRNEHVGRLEEENRRRQEHESQMPTKVRSSIIYLIVVSLLVPTHALQSDRVDPTGFHCLKDEVEILKAESLAWEARQTTLAQLNRTQENVNHNHPIRGHYGGS